MLTIIDYGMGNLRSVQKGFEHAGVPSVEISADPDKVAASSGLVLPGVGAFRDAMIKLNQSGLREALTSAVSHGVPLLGICLGMQLLLEVSYENGRYEGLNLVPGSCQRFDDATLPIKVPHIGWNTVVATPDNPLMAGIEQHRYFYFVHSYHCALSESADVLGTTEYGIPFTSALNHHNIYATQFHPEKSSTIGLQLLANFARICGETPHLRQFDTSSNQPDTHPRQPDTHPRQLDIHPRHSDTPHPRHSERKRSERKRCEVIAFRTQRGEADALRRQLDSESIFSAEDGFRVKPGMTEGGLESGGN